MSSPDAPAPPPPPTLTPAPERSVADARSLTDAEDAFCPTVWRGVRRKLSLAAIFFSNLRSMSICAAGILGLALGGVGARIEEACSPAKADPSVSVPRPPKSAAPPPPPPTVLVVCIARSSASRSARAVAVRANTSGKVRCWIVVRMR